MRGRPWGILILVLALGLLALPFQVPPAAASRPLPHPSHAPVAIDGNAGFTSANGVMGGKGTADDPYIIRDWDIDAAGANGISISNTNAYFVVRNVLVHSSGNSYSSIRLYNATHGRVEGSTLVGGGAGVYGSLCAGLQLVGNNLTSSSGSGVYLDSCAGPYLEGNGVRGNGVGINLFSSHDAVARGNNVSDNVGGFQLWAQLNTTIANNTVGGNLNAGFTLIDHVEARIRGNVIRGNGDGVWAHYSWGTTIAANNVSSNLRGIYLENAQAMSIVGNALVGNGHGIVLYYPQNLLLHHNNFIDNHEQANATGGLGVAWDGGYNLLGNFWSDYRGMDNCGGPNQTLCPGADGVGDTPYILNSGAQDHYPLIYPIHDVLPPTIAIVSPREGDHLTTNTVNVVGTASDGGGSGLDRVEVRINGGAWTQATGTSSWTAALQPNIGPNAIEALAWDRERNPSDPVAVHVQYDRPGMARHDPIHIWGNAGFTADNGVKAGRGIPNDPYIIEGWEINASSAHGIDVRNTNAYLVVRNVYLWNGALYAGNFAYYDGVHLVNVTHARLEGITSLNNTDGARIEWSSDVAVLNSTLVGNQGDGVHLVGSDHALLSGNGARGNGAVGIRVESSRTVTVRGNLLSGNWGGIHLERSDRIQVIGDTLTSPQPNGLYLGWSTNVTASGNDLGSSGLFIYGETREEYTTHDATQGNSVNGKPLIFLRDCDGVSVEGVEVGQLFFVQCRNVKATNLAVHGTLVGIEMAFVDNGTIAASNLSANSDGAYVAYSSNITLVGNTVEDVHEGIFLEAPRDTLVVGNLIARASTGVEAQLGYRTWISNLTVVANRVSAWNEGIRIVGSNNSSVIGNLVTDAQWAGISLVEAPETLVVGNDLAANYQGLLVDSSQRVLVVHNNFLGNTVQAAIRGAEVWWDAGYPLGGNYWSDYHGRDDCSGPAQDVCQDPDGLGDTPRGSDPYPLMRPFDWSNRTPVAILTHAPWPPFASEPTAFNASYSYAREGDLVAYAWDFGDGATALGATATHAYATSGTYRVQLTVTDGEGRVAFTTALVHVLALPEVPLVPYHSPTGFSLPVPQGWEVQENVSVEGRTYELVLLGPPQGNPRSNFMVDTDVDPTLQEDEVYLGQQVHLAVDVVQRTLPDARLVGEPEYRRIANHTAVTFVIGYTNHFLIQRGAIVVDGGAHRYWFILLSTFPSEFYYLNLTFEAMLQGFSLPGAPSTQEGGGTGNTGGTGGTGATNGTTGGEKPRKPEAGPGPFLSPLITGSLAGVATLLIALVLVLRWWGWRGGPGTLREFPPPPEEGPIPCPSCGQPMGPGDPTCLHCGRALPEPPPLEDDLPPPR